MAKKNERYYIAYGSNLNVDQMAQRCPGATVVGKTLLGNYRLLFRGSPGNTHATIEPAAGYSVPVVIWKITASDESSLDRYEGVPRYYTKEIFVIRLGDEIHMALAYIMAPGNNLGAPSEPYYDVIREGYETFEFDMEILENALRDSCENKKRRGKAQ